MSDLTVRNDHQAHQMNSLINNMDDLRAHTDRQAADMSRVMVGLMSQLAQMQTRMSSLEENYEWSTTVQSSMSDDLTTVVQSSLQPIIEKLQKPLHTERRNKSHRPSCASLGPIPPADTGTSTMTSPSTWQPCQSRTSSAHLQPASSTSGYSPDQDTCQPAQASIPIESTPKPSVPCQTSSSANVYRLRPNTEPEQMVFYENAQLCSLSWRNWLGELRLNIYRETIQYSSTYTSVIRVKALLVPRLKRALHVDITYNAERISNSLTTVRVSLPRILPGEDPLVEALRYRNTNEFLAVFKRGQYRPDDLACIDGDSLPLLEVSGIP